MTGPTIAGILRLDLRVKLDASPFVAPSETRRVKRRIQELRMAPVGCVVVLQTNDPYPPPDAVRELFDAAPHVGRIIVEHDDAAALARWVLALSSAQEGGAAA